MGLFKIDPNAQYLLFIETPADMTVTEAQNMHIRLREIEKAYPNIRVATLHGGIKLAAAVQGEAAEKLIDALRAQALQDIKDDEEDDDAL